MPLVVDGRRVDIGLELFVGKCEDIGFTSLRLYAEVEITGIVPASDVHAGHLCSFSIFRKARPLVVAVDVIAHMGHQGIVEVAGVVPDAVLLSNAHVTHLHRQEVFHHGLPYATIVDVVGDAEHARPLQSIVYLIETGFGDIGEIGNEIAIAQEAAPVGGFHTADDVFAIGIDAHEAHHFRSCRLLEAVAAVGLDDNAFRLLRQIAHLRSLDDGPVAPDVVDGRRDEPAHSTFRGALGNLAAKNKPAVVVVHATVVELQLTGERLYRELLAGIVGTRSKDAAFGIGCSDDVIGT